MLMNSLGRFFMVFGIIIVVIGFLLTIHARFPFFRMPGDIVAARKNFSFYFPIVSSIITSIILTLVLNLSAKK